MRTIAMLLVLAAPACLADKLDLSAGLDSIDLSAIDRTPVQSDQYYCAVSDIQSGKCLPGDLLYAHSPAAVMIYCDTAKPIIPISNDDSNGGAICTFEGRARQRR